MGIEENKKELERIFGSDVNIFARDYATWEEGVCMFIQEVTKQKNISSIKIQNSFEIFENDKIKDFYIYDITHKNYNYKYFDTVHYV